MKILFAASEAVPYWKTGGLADVARALPDALAARGHEVRIIHPLYRAVREQRLPLRELRPARIPWPGRPLRVRYFEHRPESGASAILIDYPRAYDVGHPYAPDARDPLALGRRFALFGRAACERARAWRADILHLNDWPTGLAALYARLDGVRATTIFAIHNLAYQGNFPPRLLTRVGVPAEYFRTEDGIEFYGSASFLKAGLVFSDRLVTVSPTYAREIQQPEFGAGMDGLLRQRRAVLRGILNGIDPANWDPARDPAVPRPYDARHLERKEENRAALVRELGLDARAPIVVMVTRLAEQKGIDLVLAALPALLRIPVRLAVLGSGDAAYEQAFTRAAEQQPRRVAVRLGFDDALARRLYAGGDFFLMPSRYEPCGLGQMIAQRYGTVPIVRATGGLVDTVQEGKTGFLFPEAAPRALVRAVRRARAVWRTAEWDALRRRCMRLDWSWTRSAARYEKLYADALRARKKPAVSRRNAP